MDSFSFDYARRQELGVVDLRPETPEEARIDRMQHLMSLKGRPTKSKDPAILEHVTGIKTFGSFEKESIGATNRWGERVSKTVDKRLGKQDK